MAVAGPMGRRRFLAASGAAFLGMAAGRAGAVPQEVIRRPIPSSGEAIPAIGLGTWIAFDVGDDSAARKRCRVVLQTFFDRGGTVIDSSPMYGSAEEVVGNLLPRIRPPAPPFCATKVWTSGQEAGASQMERSRALWGVQRFDLMQVHNLVDWESHLETLKRWKAEGRVRYVGITTSHGLRHAEFARVMAQEPLDFVQFTYSIAARRAEARLLPLAAERRIAVIANRPFDGGGLFRRVRSRPLPPFAREIGCESWAQYFLKFIISHPAVTCAIPATSRLEHLTDNMGALTGPLPDAELRRRMAVHLESP